MHFLVRYLPQLLPALDKRLRKHHVHEQAKTPTKAEIRRIIEEGTKVIATCSQVPAAKPKRSKQTKQKAKPEPLPTPISSMTELDQCSKRAQESLEVLAKLDLKISEAKAFSLRRKFMMQELASARSARDYTNQIVSRMSR